MESAGRPYTYEQAKELRNYYLHLIGTEHRKTSNWLHSVIEEIAISPYDALNKQFFFEFYLETHDKDTAINFYTFHEYDLMIITRNTYANGRSFHRYYPLPNMSFKEKQPEVQA